MPLRPEFGLLCAANKETRTPERLRAHYQLEQCLAAQLKAAGPDERGRIYGELYNALFSALPDHPQHSADPGRRARDVAVQVDFLRGFAGAGLSFAEIGCGDAAVTKGLAPYMLESIGVDVTPALIDAAQAPDNFHFAKAEGAAIDLPDAAVDLAYSNQLMEHLHPDDAVAQLGEIFRILKPGGRYICITPSRISGPHDISMYFGYEPRGFHLREYDYASLSAAFRKTGFVHLQAHARIKGWDFVLPLWTARLFEKLMLTLPRGVRTRVMLAPPARTLAGLTLIGRKPLVRQPSGGCDQ
jgi:SAM-dependent methyltransferase